MAEEVVAALDVLEQILLRVDVKDLIRFKSVCKSWLSFISSPRFVKYQLNHNIKSDRNNHQLGHRRIYIYKARTYDTTYSVALILDYIVGSCNGLVCVSPKFTDEFLVTNPFTREEKKLKTPPSRFRKGESITWGFGYDSSSDDYKVVAGFRKGYSDLTVFNVLTFKSNTWKVIGELNYVNMACKTGVLCDGVLYWLMYSNNYRKEVIISLDLSTEELKEIPQPDDADYKKGTCHKLGILQDCLCIYSSYAPHVSSKSSNTRVMINNKWELYIDQQSKYDVAHCLFTVDDSRKKRGYVYSFSHCDGHRVPYNGDYVSSSLFVKSLVSPHPHVHEEDNEGVESGAKGNIRKKKSNRNRKEDNEGVESGAEANIRKKDRNKKYRKQLKAT